MPGALSIIAPTKRPSFVPSNVPGALSTSRPNTFLPTYRGTSASPVAGFAKYKASSAPSTLHQGAVSLPGKSDTGLTTNNDSKIIIGIVVSIILAVLFVAIMYILYRKYKTNNNTKENKDYNLEIFYSTTNNYENQH